MCDSVILDKRTMSPIDISSGKYSLIYERYGKRFTLLDGFQMEGVIDFASCSQITDAHGVSKGYMLIIGEAK